MINSKTLGAAAGVQYQGVIDKSEGTNLPSLANGVIVGRFKRGRMDKPFKVTASNYQALLGRDPSNPSYLAVEDAFKRGISEVSVLRTGRSISGAGTVKPTVPVNTGTIIFSVESYENPSSGYLLYVYIDEPVGDWSITDSGVVIVDSTGFAIDGIELDIYEGGADIYINIPSSTTSHFEIDVTAGYVDLSYYGDDEDYTENPLGNVVISQFSSRVPEFSTGFVNTLLTVPEHIPPELVNTGYLFYDANLFNQDISMWDVSNVVNMNGMFVRSATFNQDLSKWCVAKIPFGAEEFANGATAWTLPKPVWGTCPRGEGGNTNYMPDAVLPSQQPSEPNSYIRLAPVTPVFDIDDPATTNSEGEIWLS